MLAVRCKGASGFHDIRGITKEVKQLAGLHDTTILQGSGATVQRVLSARVDPQWLHLACHGIQTADEVYRSNFVMKDGLLYLANIIWMKLHKPEFAFLSACHTATGVLEMSEEAMHLAGGLHCAGYTRTIATMWSVHDKAAIKVAKEVYGLLSRDPHMSAKAEDAAEAL